MILTQDREKAVKAGTYIYVNADNYSFQVVNELGKRKTVLGEYETKSHAEETLKTIFQYIRCKKPCYAMPEGREGANE